MGGTHRHKVPLKKMGGGPRTSMERSGKQWAQGLMRRTKYSVAEAALSTVMFFEENGRHRVYARVSKSNARNS